ncbi:uncharacterized protein B0T23DRAFT_306374 [Neurospora hispaniola]|uniref:Uncharacterized protein n=1 Tax=Neurospora hispaniola TaxID=588809 RepID=A0AAJ0IEW7_9PEZI|nr:hypothetical protein B0T23DRAFT_306374 [Neurospora hispaniola]
MKKKRGKRTKVHAGSGVLTQSLCAGLEPICRPGNGSVIYLAVDCTATPHTKAYPLVP